MFSSYGMLIEDFIVNSKMNTLDITAFRGDDRAPKIIFREGFQRRGSQLKYYQKNNKKIMEPTFRLNNEDISPPSAVCLTLNIDCAPIFPIEATDKTWIYIVKAHTAFETYKLQNQTGSFPAFCDEIAIRDIPPGDIICAIECERFYKMNNEFEINWYNGIYYRFVNDIIWNPQLANEPETACKQKRKNDILKLINARKDKYIVCPIPSNYEPYYKIDHKNNIFTIDSVDHIDIQNLFQFARCMNRDLRENETQDEREKEAISFLEKCSDLDRMIPGINLNPLMFSCEKNSLNVVKYLLSKNVKVDIQDSLGITPIFLAKEPEIKNLLKKSKTKQTVLGFFNSNFSEKNSIKISTSKESRCSIM